jgi:D-glycero-alpha-D-manno-heptose-7-phosphate kinase
LIITKTPFRISFVGGGSDLEAFYSHHDGGVLSVTINKYMYLTSHRFFDRDKVQVKYSQTETVTDIQQLNHPIFRVMFEKFNYKKGLEVTSVADIASGTGMGSSSSFTVGLLHNFYTRTGQFVSKEKLAHDACEIEIDILKEPIGKQDQYAAAFGGLNIFRFKKDGKVLVEPLFLKKEVYDVFQDNLLLFYLGNQRKASDILQQQKQNISEQAKFDSLKQMVQLVDELRNCLYAGNVNDVGRLLHENWLMKKSLASEISNSNINDLYELGLKSGALGGKLLGAGGGGFLLFYCEKEKQQKVIDALKNIRTFDFKFETEGSKLLYVGDDEQYN